LDEISEISLKLQAKLLRVLQEREFERVGGNRTIKVNVRVLATTNRDLQKSVENQEFRQDLYYRLNVFPIIVPPLRKRKDDLQGLAEGFLSRIARRSGAQPPVLTPASLRVLQNYEWPGNVRELQNVMERAVILTEPGQEITPQFLEPMFPVGLLDHSWKEEPAEPLERVDAQNSGIVFPENIVSLEELEREYILHALRKANGNRTHTAQMLGISIRTLRNKLNELKLGEQQAV
jgi:transcriptional regulator with GAF, ATPase, and Fis domain